MVALNFNAQGVAPQAALEPLPSGVYDVTMTNSVEKPTKDGQGMYVECEYTVRSPDPALNGRKVFDRLNLKNNSQQAVDIAYGTLSAICHVTGRFQIQDTAQLHGIPLKVVVAKVERTDQKGTFSNDVKGYKDQNGNDPGQQGQGGGQPQGGQPGGAPGWANGPQQGQPQQNYGGQPQAQPQPGYGGQPQTGYNPQPQPGQQVTGGQPPAWASNGGQPQPGYDQGHQQGHGTPGHGGPGQPGMGEQHAYNQPAGGQPQPGPQGGQPPAWAGNGQGGGQPQGQNGGQPYNPAPNPQAGGVGGAAPPWAQNGGQPQG